MNLQIKGPVINYGEESYKTGGGGQVLLLRKGEGGQVLPLRKGEGVGKVLAMLGVGGRGGAQKVLR